MEQNIVREPVPLDGGWGWFICLGSSLITMSLRSLDPSFGLLFGDLIRDLKIDSTSTSLIMSMLDANINFSGLFIGFLLKRYSYRKVALFGSILNSTGLILTSQASSLTHIILTYSIVGGLGTGLAISSAFVALNTFFLKKRGQAIGFSMAGTTLGMMIMPQLVHYLLNIYGFRGTTLIIGGISLHALAGSCLLRPICLAKVTEKNSENLEIRGNSWKNKILDEKSREDELLIKKDSDIKVEISFETIDDPSVQENLISDVHVKEKEIPDKNQSYFKRIKELLGLDLLLDLTFLNILIGLSLYYVAETNFKLFTPFFLTNIGMTKKEVAFCLSLIAFMDILARLVLPTLFDKFGFRKRYTFWICSLFIGIGRSVFAEGSNDSSLFVFLVIIGFFRGATLVNMNLTISETCSLESLPHAFGIFMVFKGTFVVFLSPLIGYVRDFTNSYRICIHIMTGLIFISFAIWGIEFCYKNVNSFLKNGTKRPTGLQTNYRTFG